MTKSPSQQPAPGFTLLEVMVGLMVLSIGLLGIAGLQIKAKQVTIDSVQRTTATLLASDIIQRMRANPREVDGHYLIPLDAAITEADTVNAVAEDFDAFPATQCVSNLTACTTAQLALYDLKGWRNALIGTSETLAGANTGGLVQPAACIIQARQGGAAGPGDYRVDIVWRGKTKQSNPTITGDPAGSNCGENTGFYDDTAGDNVYRRLAYIYFHIDQ